MNSHVSYILSTHIPSSVQVILTLFGYAFSPREEFLILSLFNLAVGQELKAVQNVGDLISMDSVVPKMVITYNRRKQGKHMELRGSAWVAGVV